MTGDDYEACPLCKSEGNTIREDIEYGIGEDGKAFVNFEAKCIACGAAWKIRVEGVDHE